MKKLILSGSALLLSLGFASAQGWSATGVYDDFATTQYANGPNGEGLYWFETTSGANLTLGHTGNGSLDVTATNAGGCDDATPNCYPVFGVQFGNNAGTPYTIDLSGGADLKLNIENTSDDYLVLTVTLQDVNGIQAKFEPNVTDVTPASTWGGTPSERKSLNGFTMDGVTASEDVTIDLSSLGNYGGLSQNGAYDCGPGPYNCPPTSYQIDATKIVSIVFTVNTGHDDIFVSEADGDPTIDNYIPGANITPFNGVFTLHSFRIGNFVVTSSKKDAQVENSLSVYPNPADDALTVKFDAANGADVSLSDLLGNKVISTTANAGSNQIVLNTSNLSKGIYILDVLTQNGRGTRKVTIK